MTIVAPADAEEMRRLMPLTVDHPGPIYIRLAKGGDPIVTDERLPFAIGKAYPTAGRERRADGDHRRHAQAGPGRGRDCWPADGLQAAVVHVPTVKPLDRQPCSAIAEQAPVIVAVEEHSRDRRVGQRRGGTDGRGGFCRPEAFPARRYPRRVPRSIRLSGQPDAALRHHCAKSVAVARLCKTEPFGISLPFKENTVGRLLNIVTPLHKRTKRDYWPGWWTTRSTACSRPRNMSTTTGTATAATATAATSYDGRWKVVAEKLIETYGLKPGAKILDVGCGKAHSALRVAAIVAGVECVGLRHFAARPGRRSGGHPRQPLPLPRPGRLSLRRQALRSGDLAGQLHNLRMFELKTALGKSSASAGSSYVMLESYRNEQEMFNLSAGR